jgi:peptidyl-prolyl cis-trans isomerase A (cyclophilin A)
MKTLIIILLSAFIACCTCNTNPKVLISTEAGDIEIELYTDKAPVTAGNFLRYVDSGKYNTAACFYRTVRLDNQPGKKTVIEVIQGGFYQDSLIEKYQFAPIRHETTKETGILHLDGVISMARNEPGTASSEFFICIGDQPALDFNGKRNADGQGFAAFGKVIRGMDVVRKIQQMKDSSQYLLQTVKIKSVSRIKD